MKVTASTRRALAIRKDERDRISAGWEHVGESGGRLWELHRGVRCRHVITEVAVDAAGKGLWIKITPPAEASKPE